MMILWSFIKRVLTPKKDYGSLKTVTFGDESAVTSNTVASIVSIVLIFVLWASFTGSNWLPRFLHVPAPYVGETSFTYTASDGAGQTDDATVSLIVHPFGSEPEAPEITPGDGFAKNDLITLVAARSQVVRVDSNDDLGRDENVQITAINGTPIEPGGTVNTDFGRVEMTPKGSLNVFGAAGWQMEAIWLPPPEDVWGQLTGIAEDGFRNTVLLEHLGFSLFRVVIGFLLGALIGIPLGYAMGLSNWFRGWFDPIVEFMRPVPPLALIPLVIIWFGIGEVGKVILLFLAALWIMAIAARSGVSGVRISKVHAAYSLGASKWQIMRHVIVPNSLPEVFTGARVAMGVCWGTVVAAELVAAEKGAGMMIMVASKFQQTDIVLLGIILIGIIGFGIDMLIRGLERWLVPWKGKG
ncbi:ABC transporter permease subunit [Cognatiyoonia koreensis]|nr:ABC transporter permease subunit [Cognatiyoonia koreensis]